MIRLWLINWFKLWRKPNIITRLWIKWFDSVWNRRVTAWINSEVVRARRGETNYNFYFLCVCLLFPSLTPLVAKQLAMTASCQLLIGQKWRRCSILKPWYERGSNLYHYHYYYCVCGKVPWCVCRTQCGFRRTKACGLFHSKAVSLLIIFLALAARSKQIMKPF